MAGIKYIPKKETEAITLGNISLAPVEGGKIAVSNIAVTNDFGKRMGYKKGDEIVSFNGEEVNAVNFGTAAKKFTSTAKEGDTLTVKVKRKNDAGQEEMVTLAAPAAKATKTEENLLEFDAASSADQLKVRNAWLNQPCSK